MTRRNRPAVLVPSICAWCAQPFTANRSSGPVPLEPSCSDRCRHYLTKRRLGRWTPEDRACTVCASSFIAKIPTARYCSRRCGFQARDHRPRIEPHRLRPVACSGCGVPTLTRGTRVRCTGCSEAQARLTNRLKNTKRRGIHATRYSREQIGQRDGWVCHLCRDAIDPTLSGMAPGGATIDHIVPVSKGGSDHPANVAIAHRQCNVRRGARPIAGAA